MLASVRRKRILELIEHFGWIHIDDLERELGISVATVRRDLARLEDDQMLIRKRGGAVSINNPLEKEKSYLIKSMDNLAAKISIAEQTISLISPGMSIFLDAGTTILEVAKLLDSIRDLTLITNDLKTALHLCSLPHELYFLGGMVQRETSSVISNTSDGAFDFSVDIALLGASSINLDFEAFSPTQMKASLKRLVRSKARLSYLLVDASKFGKRSLFRIDALADYSGVITDKSFSSATMRMMNELGINVIHVTPEKS